MKITDEKTKVTAAKIKTAIAKIVNSDSYEQLFIYFAGHGVNLAYSEYWLLSKAPVDTNEAVNVASSVHLAKRSGIPHVVLISDACRTAPEGIRAQAVRGSEIFPNQGRGGLQKAVDVFYASLLGEPALEIQDKNDSASSYVSIYTEELVAALRGDRRALLTPDAADKKKVYLRPRPLKRHLTTEVPKLVAAKLGATSPHSQTPDAEILSDELAYLQEFDAAAVAPPPPAVASGGPFGIGPRLPRAAAPPPPPPPPPPTVADVAAKALKEALDAPKGADAVKAVEGALRRKVPGTTQLAKAVKREREQYGETIFETRCGFKVRGATITAFHSTPNVVFMLKTPESVAVDTAQQPAASVVLELSGDRVVVLPAIRDFIAALTVENGELRNVSYEPSDHTSRWTQYAAKREELTALRALIASAVHMGTFRLESDDAPKLTEKIRFMKGLDPTMALYAAYSYHRLGKRDLIRKMEEYLVEDLRLSLFDVAMLADRDPKKEPLNAKVYPFVPMLAQGWSLLGAFDEWTPLLEKLRPYVVNSLWTLFEKDALPLLRKELKKG